MKILIAVVMFLFGLFVGILAMPFISEVTSPLYLEEEYSTPRIKTLLHGFGITLPLEASDVNLFLKQDGQVKHLWLKFECPQETTDAFVAQLSASHSGLFNREIETPKLFDGSPITWWTYRNSYRYYEFNDMCAAYDDLMRNFYLYAVSDGSSKPSASPASQE